MPFKFLTLRPKIHVYSTSVEMRMVYLPLHVDISFVKYSQCQTILLLQRNELFKRKVEVARHLRILSFFLEHALKENDLSRVLSMDTENANGGF